MLDTQAGVRSAWRLRARRWAGIGSRPVHSMSRTMHQPRSKTSPKHLRLGALLRAARVAAGLTQKALAALLGRRQAFVSKYEKRSSGLDAVDFLAIVDLTGADVATVAEAIRDTKED